MPAIRQLVEHVRSQSVKPWDIPFFIKTVAGTVVDSASSRILPHARQEILRVLGMLGCDSALSCERWMESADWMAVARPSSADGQHHQAHKQGDLAQLCAILFLASPKTSAQSDWLDSLPPADARTLHCVFHGCFQHAQPRVLVSCSFYEDGCCLCL